MQAQEIIKKNLERLKVIESPYNPLTGEGSFSIERVKVTCEDFPLKEMWLPVEFANTGFCQVLMSLGIRLYIERIMQQAYTEYMANLLYVEFCQQRFLYDFEFWAYSCAIISPKSGGEDIHFLLNRAQRTYLCTLEKLRKNNEPINIILLKARQWGGSTLTQIYMLWIQIIHKKNWNSVICGDVDSQSKTVSGMLSKVIQHYPTWATNGISLKTTPFEGSSKQGRYSIVSVYTQSDLPRNRIAFVLKIYLWPT